MISRRNGRMRRRYHFTPFIALLLSAVFLIPMGTLEHGPGAAAAVSGPGFCGSSETFWIVSMGTDAPSSIQCLSLVPLASADSVVLDGFLYLMTQANTAGSVATYSP